MKCLDLHVVEQQRPKKGLIFRLTATGITTCGDVNKCDAIPSLFMKMHDDTLESCGVLRKPTFLTPTPLQG